MSLLFLTGGLTAPTFPMRQITHWFAGSSGLFFSTFATLGTFSTSVSLLEAAEDGLGTSVIRVSRICKQQPSTQPVCQLQQHTCSRMYTLSSALSRISLSGKAPSRCIHLSRTSWGSDSSSLTGTTRDPIGWSHALDSCRHTPDHELEMFLVCGSSVVLHPPSLWAFPLWGCEPESKKLHSTGGSWSAHTPSNRKRMRQRKQYKYMQFVKWVWVQF